ncbi:glycine betaine ABC transporter substrate-binding protein [Amphritea sp. 1_MG-2023]|uniref:glycine betaine ABC transporter substrate-binding protein n=1 Tax=Amphritea sp. 1_MG-2023 TaxID=3062670 RepID=UPI0026E3BF59|nr:glycine betaine ABC transporter substrate-binding protein [Amphritea sp. 1_MG-2023]MDO6563551.1 glycine betaine ABC transporter substrate-binding protein [Amphritea sp. 1_MG-2023]
MKKSFMAVAALIAGTSIMSSSAYAQCGEVSISEMNWSSSQLVTSVSKFLMEQGYGCTVQTVPTSTVPSVTSIAETGKPDIVTELWLNSVPLYTELEQQGKVITATQIISDGGKDAWWVPQYLVDQYPQLKTIDGVLANPELVGGRFHNAPDGWGVRIKNDNLIKAFDFASHGMEVFNHGSGETLAAAIASANEAKEPIFVYYWAPTSVLGKYPMVAVDLGPFNAEAHACIESKDCADPQKTALKAGTVVTGVTSDFANREPEIFELMKHISFTSEEMSQLLAWQESNKASAEEAAVYFITTQQDKWSGWINDDARAKLTALLN